MENSKRSTEGAPDGSTSLCQRLHRQEGAARDASTASGYRANSVRPLGSSSSIAYRQLPCYPRWWIDNDDLLTTIDNHGQGLTECLSLVESTMAMARCRSPPMADSVDDKLAKAETRIAGEIFIITFVSSQFHL